MRVHFLKVFVPFRWGHSEKLHAIAVQQHFQFVRLVQAFDLLVSIAREADLDVILTVAWKRVGQQGATARAEWKSFNVLLLRKVPPDPKSVPAWCAARRADSQPADFLGGGDVATQKCW